MDKKLQLKLLNDFPLLYADKDKPSYYSLVCFGFECFNGWYDIIYELSSKVEPLIREWIDENGEDGHPRALQVKEKFGTLRFYMTTANDEMYKEINKAEMMSGITCEACGKPGKRRGEGWVFTLCNECHKKKENGWRPYQDEER